LRPPSIGWGASLIKSLSVYIGTLAKSLRNFFGSRRVADYRAKNNLLNTSLVLAKPCVNRYIFYNKKIEPERSSAATREDQDRRGVIVGASGGAAFVRLKAIIWPLVHFE
jgi:hypothetical protein